METGRKPRESNQESDFRSKLEEWVRAKNIDTFGKSVEQTARSLQYLINKYGTKLWREGGRKDIITPIFADERFQKLNKKIAEVEFKKVLKAVDNA